MKKVIVVIVILLSVCFCLNADSWKSKISNGVSFLKQKALDSYYGETEETSVDGPFGVNFGWSVDKFKRNVKSCWEGEWYSYDNSVGFWFTPKDEYTLSTFSSYHVEIGKDVGVFEIIAGKNYNDYQKAVDAYYDIYSMLVDVYGDNPDLCYLANKDAKQLTEITSQEEFDNFFQYKQSRAAWLAGSMGVQLNWRIYTDGSFGIEIQYVDYDRRDNIKNQYKRVL